jgi:hypothetical protein
LTPITLCHVCPTPALFVSYQEYERGRVCSHILERGFSLGTITSITMPRSSLHTTSLIERQDIDKIAARAEELATHSWEYGAVSNALIEIYDPSLSPFFGDISTVRKETYSKARGLQYAKKFIVTDKDVLCDGEGK